MSVKRILIKVIVSKTNIAAENFWLVSVKKNIIKGYLLLLKRITDDLKQMYNKISKWRIILNQLTLTSKS